MNDNSKFEQRILIILTVGVLSFAIGWWTSDMKHATNKIVTKSENVSDLYKDTFYPNDKIKVTCANKKKTIQDFVSDDKFIHWAPHHPDTTSYMCDISLQKITVLYWYHGQCGYDYFSYLTSDTTIDVLWSYRADCILNMDFLEKSNGVKKYPKRGDDFATLTLVNDTTLRVTYNFPEGTKKVNEIVKDSLFPTNYYLQQDK
ncbi:hypothetical protein QEG73_12735 [Chitinophagaceae bacterium 26-R-25]|nr:hypothetical protein [Chitinophagaceae bacterium 26-R-25]